MPMNAPLNTVPRAAVTVDKVETLMIDQPTIRPHRLSLATMNGQTIMPVQIYCSGGTIGWDDDSIISGLSCGAESQEGMNLASDTCFAPVLLGADAEVGRRRARAA